MPSPIFQDTMQHGFIVRNLVHKRINNREVGRSQERDISLLSKYLAQFNKAAVQDIDLSHILRAVHFPGEEQAVLQQEHLGRLFLRADDPVFPHPGPLVQVQFHQAVVALGGGREDFRPPCPALPCSRGCPACRGRHTTEISGSTIVSTSSGASPAFSNRRTAKGGSIRFTLFPL